MRLRQCRLRYQCFRAKTGHRTDDTAPTDGQPEPMTIDRWTFSLAVLLAVAGAWGSAGHWPLYLLTCLLVPAVKVRPQPSGVLLALLSGLGYWWGAGAEPLAHNAVWCLPAAVTGWYLARQTESYRALVIVTAAAAAFTIPAGVAPLPATALLIGSAVSRWNR